MASPCAASSAPRSRFSPNSTTAGRAGPGRGGADVQGTLDGVLGRLVAQHGHRGLHVGEAAGLHGDVEELARDHLRPAQVEHVERGGDLLERQAADGERAIVVIGQVFSVNTKKFGPGLVDLQRMAEEAEPRSEAPAMPTSFFEQLRARLLAALARDLLLSRPCVAFFSLARCGRPAFLLQGVCRAS